MRPGGDGLNATHGFLSLSFFSFVWVGRSILFYFLLFNEEEGVRSSGEGGESGTVIL
jgi:hypothetical protein